MNKPKIIVFDLETINLKADLSPILCFGWKIHGEGGARCIGIWDYPVKERPFDDRRLCREIAKIMSEADAVVAHFGRGFDWPFLKSRLLYNRAGFLPPLRVLDTWKIAKDNLLITSNRLKSVAKFLRLKQQKGDSGGWDTWLNVVNGNKRAIAKMAWYCKQDVRCLDAVFTALRPFIKDMPSWSALNNRAVCPSCGSQSCQRRGREITRTRVRTRWNCRGCGSWFYFNKDQLPIKSTLANSPPRSKRR